MPEVAGPGRAAGRPEVRFGLVLYGGVSLAVYMSGVVTEFWHLVRAAREAPRLREVRWLRLSVRAMVADFLPVSTEVLLDTFVISALLRPAVSRR